MRCFDSGKKGRGKGRERGGGREGSECGHSTLDAMFYLTNMNS